MPSVANKRVLSEDESEALETDLAEHSVVEAQARASYTFADEVIAQYEELGVTGRPRPILDEAHERIFPGLQAGEYYDGRMPPSLKVLSLEDVSAAMSLSCNWLGYLYGQYAGVMVARKEAMKRKEAIWSIVRNSYRKIGKYHGASLTDQKLSDFARGDRRFIEADAEYEKLNAVYNTLEAIIDVTKKELETISREVTIRQTILESETRGRGMHNRMSGPNPATVAFPKDERRKVGGSASKGKTPNRIGARVRNQNGAR